MKHLIIWDIAARLPLSLDRFLAAFSDVGQNFSLHSTFEISGIGPGSDKTNCDQ